MPQQLSYQLTEKKYELNIVNVYLNQNGILNCMLYREFSLLFP